MAGAAPEGRLSDCAWHHGPRPCWLVGGLYRIRHGLTSFSLGYSLLAAAAIPTEEGMRSTAQHSLADVRQRRCEAHVAPGQVVWVEEQICQLTWCGYPAICTATSRLGPSRLRLCTMAAIPRFALSSGGPWHGGERLIKMQKRSRHVL